MANNVQAAPGQAKGYYTLTNVAADTGLADVESFRQMVVKAENGALIRLGDIATIELGAKSSDSSVAMNGQRLAAWRTYADGLQRFPDSLPLARAAGRLAVVLKR